MSRSRQVGQALERVSEAVTRWTGSSLAFTLAVAVLLVWVCTGPLFHFSDTWQLVVNTGTTIVTFLMVFLIQRSQNKDALAVHLKLNELVASLEGASNRLIDVEALSERDLRALERHFGELARLAREDENPTNSHTVEEARRRHSAKSVVAKRGKPRAS
jgi:low affinity Fe/Cu permease